MPVGECNVAWQVSQPTGEAGATDRFSFTVLSSTAVDPGATTVPGATTPTTTPAAGGETSDDDEILDASEVSDGATWLGRVLSTLGLAVLFGSLALIIAAWPEGPEYILAVRFLRSVWLLTLAGTRALRRRPRAPRCAASRSAAGSTRPAGSTCSTPGGRGGPRSPGSCSSSPVRGW